MSSTMDDVTCPNCGEYARREQDNTSGDVEVYCPSCKYREENGEVINEGEEQ